MIIVRVLLGLVFVLGLVLSAFGLWGIHQHQIFWNKRPSVHSRERVMCAQEFVLSFCSQNKCSIKEMPQYCRSCLFVGTLIMVAVEPYLLGF